MTDDELAAQLSHLEKRVLRALEAPGRASPEELLVKGGFDKLVEVMNAASWLQAKGLVTIHESISKAYTLRRKDAATRPLAERAVAQVLVEDLGGSASLADLKATGKVSNEDIQIALGWIKRKGWGEISKKDNNTVITMTDLGREALGSRGKDELLIDMLSEGEVMEGDADGEVLESLRQRKDFLNERHVVSRTIELTDRGREVASVPFEVKEEVAQLTPELIQSGRWKDVDLRRYDVKAFAPTSSGGKKHPMTILIEKVRDAFLTMGFSEIRGQYVESAFWNMDALFTAQDHPAREMQDTFYLENPSRIDLSQDREYVDIVRQVHEDGWRTGSLGWGYRWSLEEAQRALLRTHTTVNTLRHIYKDPSLPFKVFSIGRIFRNEAMDSTHLPEFTQIEGVVSEEGADFDMLCGLLKEFYRRMCPEEIRIRPGYFPYTEPSLEVDILWKDQWMELGGAGVFRPEVTEPLGLKEPVLAWGLGLERLGMLMWGLEDIRDIYVSDLDWLKKSEQL